MKVQQRRYKGGTDKPLMLALAHARLEDNLHVVDLPHRLSSEAPDTPENVGLRVNEGGKRRPESSCKLPSGRLTTQSTPTRPPTRTDACRRGPTGGRRRRAALALYRSVGFQVIEQVIEEVRVYRKEYPKNV